MAWATVGLPAGGVAKLNNLVFAFVGKLDIEFLIAFLFLYPDASKAAPAIETRPAPAFKKESSVADLVASFITSEMAPPVGCHGVPSGFLSSFLVPSLYI